MIGLGEVSCTPVWSGEDAVTATHIIKGFLEPALKGEDPRDIERLTAKMRRAVAGHPFTKSGIEIALLGHSRQGRRSACLSLARWCRSYTSTDQDVCVRCRAITCSRTRNLGHEQGLKALKVKVGIEPEGDLARVRAVREAIGPSVRLGVDANGGWSVRVAIDTIRRMAAECNIYFAEQPVAPVDIQWLADVRRSVPVPLWRTRAAIRCKMPWR